MAFDYISLDTNALRGTGWPRVDADLENLLQFARMLKIEICVPESVFLELEDFWKATYQKRVEDAQKALLKLEKIAQNPEVLKGVRVPTLRDLLLDYTKTAETVRDKWEIETIPITTRPVEELFRMAARKEPPFRQNGVGFKDAVILFSLFDFLSGKKGRGKNGRVLLDFITADSDFEDESLIRAGEKAGVELSFCHNIREMNERITATLQASVKALASRDQSEALKALEGIRPQIEGALNAQLEIPPSELLPFNISDNFQVNRVELIGIEKVRTSHSLLSGDDQGPIKIAADIPIEIKLLVTRRVYPQDSPLRVGQGWHPTLNILARMSDTKVETTEESVRKTAILEAIGVKTSQGYTNVEQISVRLAKRSAFYGD